MPFEDLLKPKIVCRVCTFLAGLDAKLAAEIRAAIAKPKYSDETIARGLAQVDSEFNQAPGKQAVGSHRKASHA